MKKFTFIDLFAGAGGLSEGFLNEKFDSIAHIEMSSDACKTLKTRASYHYLKESNNLDVYRKYLKNEIDSDEFFEYIPKEILDRIINVKMDESNIDDIFIKIDKIISLNKINQIDLIVGGPPCQAYSLIGRAVKNDGMKDDLRNYLYRLYGRFLEKYKPKMFVFENVPGLLSANNGIYFSNMKTYFKSLGFNLDYRILNASDFGVLQNRKRIILIGWNENLDIKYPEFDCVERKYELSELFRDLPILHPGQSKSDYAKPATEYLNEYGLRDGNDILTLHIARPHNKNDIEIYKYAIELWNNDKKRMSYDLLPDELATHKNKKVFLDRYKVVASNLTASQTIMAHISKDGHYFIHPDINQSRSISVREAARIQSFPDNYFFEGSRTSAFVQIGNAVPPMMGRVIALKIKKLLIEVNNEK